MKTLVSLLFAVAFHFSQAQNVTHGPIVGGVTDNSARIFVRTSDAAAIDIQFSGNDFTSIDKTVSGTTSSGNDFSAIFDATGLSPDTKYKVRVLINSVESGYRAAFKTFPVQGQAGHYKFLFGSCIYELTDTDSSLFVQMLTEDANVFTPTGDWGYPDKTTGANDLYLSNPPTSYAADYNKVRDVYKERYSSSNGGFYYRSIVMDYTHDDHDYLNDNTAGNFANIFGIFTNFGEPVVTSQPPQARLNCLKGYHELFPHYPSVDSTEGIFHSYVLGNCEVFVLDTRSARSPQHAAIKEVSGKWVIQEPPGHSILGQVQMNWLLNGLQNSTADWKFIVSSVIYNRGYRAAMDSLLAIGKGTSPILGLDVNGIQISTGLIGAGQLSDLWTGFPSDQDTLFNFIQNHDIKNVFLISGDAHTAALDDGTNSGIPELLSANLKKANSSDAVTFQNFLGYTLWNKGASGIGGANLNNTYGKVEVFGRDSVRLCAVDASGDEVVGHTFKNAALTDISSNTANPKNEFRVFPNPAGNQLFVEAMDNSVFQFILFDASGKEYVNRPLSGSNNIDIRRIPAGNYFYRILNEKNEVVSEGKVGVVR